jgi:hypothetical protein
MTLQYLRNLSLVVADPAGKGIELGAFRCVFEVKRGDNQTPNSCDVRVYNLSQSTANQLRANKNANPEFTQLVLKASYGQQPPQQIFWGSITQVRLGREDQRNSYVAFTAADGDEPYNFAPTAFTLAAGAQPIGGVRAVIADMARFSAAGRQPITEGYIPPSLKNNPNRSIRGRTYYGDAKAEMRGLADQHDCVWSVQDGQVQFVPKTGYIPEPAVVISPSTGLIGVPEQSQNGLKVRVLLNPTIKIGRLIQLQSTDVNQLRYGLETKSIATNFRSSQGQTKLNADGLYYAMRADHSGDTRGPNWYTDLTCLAVDATSLNKPTDIGIINVIPRY